MGIAKGIQYLHTGGVTGNDIKLENVLLDETLTARISSYNISLPPKVMLGNHNRQHVNFGENLVFNHLKHSQVGSESPLAGPDHFTRYYSAATFTLLSLFRAIISELSANINFIFSTKEAEKEDIYQLGIILLEVIIGRPINSRSEAEDLKLQVSITISS